MQMPSLLEQSEKEEDFKACVAMLIGCEQADQQAWGAYFAGKYGLKECVPTLKKLLGQKDGEISQNVLA